MSAAALDLPQEFMEFATSPLASMNIVDFMLQTVPKMCGPRYALARKAGWLIEVTFEIHDTPDGRSCIFDLMTTIPREMCEARNPEMYARIDPGTNFGLILKFNVSGRCRGSHETTLPTLDGDAVLDISADFEKSWADFLRIPFTVPSRMIKTDSHRAALSYMFQRMLLGSVCNTRLRFCHENGGVVLVEMDIRCLDVLAEDGDFTFRRYAPRVVGLPPVFQTLVCPGDLASKIVPGETFGVVVTLFSVEDRVALGGTFPRDVSSHPCYDLPWTTPPLVLEYDRMREFSKEKLTACYHCKTGDVKLKTCSGCMCVRYCSPECARAHWKVHKKECKYIQAAIQIETC